MSRAACRGSISTSEPDWSCRAGDAGALARRIDRLMATARAARQLGAAGRARVEHEFTLERLRERLREFYEESAVVPDVAAAC